MIIFNAVFMSNIKMPYVFIFAAMTYYMYIALDYYFFFYLFLYTIGYCIPIDYKVFAVSMQ
jgi:hypothetical protein